MSSLVGLLVFYGVLALSSPDPTALEPAAGNARTALTSFLVFVGLFLIVFVEPPIRWFAVAEPLTADRRPAYLAIGLGLAFVVVLLTPPARAFFQMIAPAPREGLIVILARARLGSAGTDLLGLPRRGPVPRAGLIAIGGG